MSSLSNLIKKLDQPHCAKVEKTVLAKHEFQHPGDNTAHIRGNERWLTPPPNNAQMNLYR